MKRFRSVLCLSLIPLVCGSALSAQLIPSDEEIPDWDVPQSVVYSVMLPAGEEEIPEPGDVRLIHENAVPTAPSTFVGITPCRVADTRGNGFGGAYGPPSLSDGNPRDFVLSGRCGIPAGIQAVSVNFTVVLPSGDGHIRVFPKGGVVPLVSTLNFRSGQTTANAALVSAGDEDAITIFSAGAGTHLLIDVNGYFVAPPTSQKLCVAINFDGPNRRDTIAVPASWTSSQCNAFRMLTVPSNDPSAYQLGCLSEAGVSLGVLDGGLPSPNCGW